MPMQCSIADTLSSNGQTLSEHPVSDAEKQSIYGHPLFPLVKTLFTMCETATGKGECQGDEGFNEYAKKYVTESVECGKSLQTDNPELDNLIMMAIQVLRIHLLELEKVSELCQDFCERYTGCIRSRLCSDALLRCTGESPDGDQLTEDGQCGGVEGRENEPVYQMVETDEGIVAHPIQVVEERDVEPACPPVIHGSTPISQIRAVPGPPQVSCSGTASGQSLQDLSLYCQGGLAGSEEGDEGAAAAKRGVLPRRATNTLRSWLFQHIGHPYPTEEEKKLLAQQTNLTLLQVNNWFINARRRILQPMLDATNVSVGGGGPPAEGEAGAPSRAEGPHPKKTKSGTRPSAERFWPQSLAESIQAGVRPTVERVHQTLQLGHPADQDLPIWKMMVTPLSQSQTEQRDSCSGPRSQASDGENLGEGEAESNGSDKTTE